MLLGVHDKEDQTGTGAIEAGGSGKPPTVRINPNISSFSLHVYSRHNLKCHHGGQRSLKKTILTNTQVAAFKVTRATLRAAPIHGPHSPPVSRLIADPGKTDTQRQRRDVKSDPF